MDGNTVALIISSIMLFIIGGYTRHLAQQAAKLWESHADHERRLGRVEGKAEALTDGLREMRDDIKEIRRMLENR